MLLVASAQWYGDGGRDNGVCYLAVDGNFQGVTGQGPTWFGQDLQAHASGYTPGTVSVTGVTAQVAAGAHTFSLDCAEDVGGGEVTMGPATISAVLLGEG
jgi:hypothetical protein